MATSRTATDRIGLRYGIYTGIAMSIYFLILNLFGLQNIEEIRFLNHIFIGIGVIMAILKVKRVNDGSISYLKGLGIGFVIGLVSSIIYGIFIYLYMTLIGQEYQNTLRTQDYFGSDISPIVQFASITLLGVVGGAFVAYILMMLYDKSGGDTSASKHLNV